MTAAAAAGAARRPAGARARRDALLDAADRVVRRDGADASMSAIAAEAGITKPILYRHFGDRTGLLQALVERHGDDLLARLREAPVRAKTRRGRTEAVVDAYLAFIEADPEVYRFLVQRAAAEEPSVRGQVVSFVDRFAAELAHWISVEMGWSARRDGLAGAWAQALVGMVQAAGDWWLDERAAGRARSRRVLVRQLVDLVWGGFAAGADDPPR